MKNIKVIEFVDIDEYGEPSPYSSGKYGELMNSYLGVREENQLTSIFSINENGELITSKSNNVKEIFKEDFAVDDVSNEDWYATHIGFGYIIINGLKFSATIEQTTNTSIIYITERTKTILENTFSL